MTITCAIHQPNFFPWLGYFDKIKRADIFVFLDNVQNQKTGGNWFNRTKLNALGKEKWYTCPIKRPSGLTNINEVEFADNNWHQSFLEILKNYYKKYPNFNSAFTIIENLLSHNSYTYINELNQKVILYFSSYFGFKTKFLTQSELYLSPDLKATDMLIDICKKVGADSYLCGGGAGNYQEDEKFEQAGINLVYQNYTVAPYGDTQKFLPGLSVIDFLMAQSHENGKS